MNWSQMPGGWKQLKTSVKERWGKLTDDDLEMIAGKRENLVSKLQERYGITNKAAQRYADTWLRILQEELERHLAGKH